MISRRTFQTGMASLVALGALPRPTSSSTQSVTAIDSHAHVFRRGLPLADARRYAPDYDATPENYIRMLDANGLSNGVLVQPSFFGTDNSYLLDALARYPDRFRGIAVVQPDVSQDELQRLSAAGIVGIRLNLIGAPDPQFQTAPWPSLLKRLADLDWQVEIQAEARRWPDLLGPLLDSGVKVVADHFGKPDPAMGVNDPGFRHLIAMGKTGRIWVKISGSYRNGAGLPAAAIPLLRDSIGLHHLVWGSDWPHTQFEKVTDYAGARAELETWLPDPTDRKVVLLETPRKLFRIGT